MGKTFLNNLPVAIKDCTIMNMFETTIKMTTIIQLNQFFKWLRKVYFCVVFELNILYMSHYSFFVSYILEIT